MSKKVFILLPAILCIALLQAQQSTTKNQQAVQQAVLKLFNALSNRDSVNLKLFCADDITLYEYGQIWNLDTLINKAIRLNTASDFKRINTIDFINTTISKKAAWTTYLNQADINRDGKQTTVKWIETVVLVKQQKRWKIKVLHSTLIK